MYRKTALLLLCALMILGLVATASRMLSRAYAQDVGPLDGWSLRVLESDARHVLLELSLPSWESDTIVHDGIAYEHLHVAGWPRWGQPGQPELPMHSVPLGMPAPGRPQIAVIETESRTVEGALLYPAPALELDGDGEAPQIVEAFTLDPDAYSADTTYPGALAEAASIGFLRDQPLFQLRLYPFQYNPLRRELRVHHRLQVLVTFPASALSVAEAGCAEPSPVFDGILERTLLNYDSLPRPTCHSTGASVVPFDALDSGPQVKLLVEQSGLYRVTHADLLAVAPDLIQSDPRRFQLSNRGTTIPMLFEGEADGTFDPGDSFLFYGQAIHSDYTRHNVYWLSDAGTPGLRMAERDGTPGTGTTPVTPTAFADSRHHEEDHIYWRTMPDGAGKDHWFWDELSVNSSTPVAADYTFDLHHIATGGPDGELRLMLHGLTGGDHLAQLHLNGVALLSAAEQAWSGQIAKLYEIAVPQDLFVEGPNHLRVENILPAGNSVSSLYVNWFEVTYQDTYVAEDDRLRFCAPSAGSYDFELTGFSNNGIELFEITDPAAPVHIVNAALEPDGDGYRLRFGDSATADQRYLAQQVDQLPTPSLQLDEPSAWKSTANGATYVIVTHPDFYSRLQSLAAHRASQGETVVIAKTEDVYDEFYHGITDPQAIRSFLEYAYEHWSPTPVYVLLVGDASMDPKNNRGTSLPDLLPAYYVDEPILGQAPNDAWYAKVHGDDDYPDLIVGRIPARWHSDVDTVTGKVQAYEGSPPPGGWVRRAVLVADDEPAFAQDMDSIADLLPPSLTPIKIYDYDPSTSVENEVNEGALLLPYSGHGTMHVWGKWGEHRILTVWDLHNGGKLPLVTAANCFNGFFSSYIHSRALAENFLLLSNKGGIASWAVANYGFPTTNSVILEELYEALLVDKDLILGSAATTARIQAHLRQPNAPLSYFELFTYFGDPAVRLNLPATLELAGGDAPDPITMGELLTHTLTYTVSGADRARGLTLVDTLPQGTTYLSASPQPSSIYGRTLTWNLGNTPAGSYALTVSARVGTDGLAHGQVLRNEAHLYDATGGDQFLEIETTVHDAPIAGLSASNDSPTELGDPTTLSAATTCGTNVVYTWDFGDGTPAGAGSSAEHTYPAIGTYLAQVTANNGVSNQSRTTTITITDVPPAASFTSSSPDRIGQTTTFQSTSRGTNLTYRWDFGDGSPPVDGQTPIITHTYALTGTHTAGLTITNSVGTSTVSGTVVILPQVEPPVASFISSSPDKIGQTTVFTSTSQDGGDDEENVVYAWDFGDGTYSAVQHPTHTYAVRETYVVSLTISNSVATDTFSDTVLITDAPITGLVISHDGPTVLGHTTAFSATVASGTYISYLWALGDGTWSTGQNLTHTYGAVGNYGVVLTATNSMGNQVVTDTVVVVDEPIDGLTLAHSGPTALGSATAFTASTTAGSNISYLWDLGDGRTSTLQNPVHTYAALGDYTVVLTATNGWGRLVRSDTVSIRDVPISGLSVSHDGPTTLGTPTTFTAAVTAGTNVIYNWELGDGHVATGAHLTHTYVVPGTYSVTVTALNSMNDEEASTSVTVLEPGRLIYLPLVFGNGSP